MVFNKNYEFIHAVEHYLGHAGKVRKGVDAKNKNLIIERLYELKGVENEALLKWAKRNLDQKIVA